MKNDIKLHNYIRKLNLSIIVNQFIYYLSHAFILSHFFNEDLTGEYEVKAGLNIAFSSLKCLKTIIGKLLLTALFIFMFKNHTDMFIFYYISFTIVICIISKITKFTIKEYNLIKLLKFDANVYGKYKIKYAIFENLFYQILPILFISKFLNLSILTTTLTILSTISIKIIFEYFFLQNIKKNNYTYKANYLLKFVIITILSTLIVVSILKRIYIPNSTMTYINILLVIISIYILKKLYSYNYVKLYKANLNEEFIIKQRTINNNIYKEETSQIRPANITYDINQKDEKNTGYNYLFSMFIKRNSKNNIGNHKRLYILTLIVTIIALLIPSILNKKNIIDIIFNYNYVLFLIVYFLCQYSSYFLFVCFMDIDRFLVNYNFYRSSSSIKENMLLRLKYTIKRNIIPSLGFSITMILYYLIYNNNADISKVIVLCILPIVLSIFYSMYHLFGYYLFQPYSFDGTVVNKFYKVFDAIIWFITYILFDNQIKLNLLYLSITTIILFVISIIFYYAIITKGTRSFRVR